jgi:7-cyano-7-deazaguanine synthase
VQPKTIIHLLSGGLDSVVLLHDLHNQGHKVHCVLFDYKQRHIQELNWARHHCHLLGVIFTTIELPQLRGSELTDGTGGVIVPNRNAIFLSLAVNIAVAAGADEVTFAANKDDEAMFPDCRMAFVQTFNNMLTTAGVQVQVCGPYLDRAKVWIVGLGREMGVKFSETWSCYRGGIQPCGECEACRKRESSLTPIAYGPVRS